MRGSINKPLPHAGALESLITADDSYDCGTNFPVCLNGRGQLIRPKKMHSTAAFVPLMRPIKLIELHSTHRRAVEFIFQSSFSSDKLLLISS